MFDVLEFTWFTLLLKNECMDDVCTNGDVTVSFNGEKVSEFFV